MSYRNDLTDMAVEFLKHKHIKDDGLIRYYEVQVDEKLSRELNKPCGKYATLETSAVINGCFSDYDRVSDALGACMKDYLKDSEKILAVGLGNPDLTADALGDRVFKRLTVTRHLNQDRYLCALTPNVLGMTGIESYDIISAVADRIRPDAILVVDALTAAAAGRIASAFQVTDSGITPGSGVENHRRRLDESSLGFKVVSVGVPLVVYSSTIAREYCPSAECGRGDMIVTPKDVDILVEDCAKIIANAINGAFAA
ncbi:MAG: GPR endopeptidase [Clostridiales bacterium]|nr:GPR endopeptidase [Clostridiales bacterium]